jgi:predicted Zn-dependent protease
LNIFNWLRTSIKHCILCLLPLFSVFAHAQDSQQLPSLGDATSGLISLQEERALGQNWLRNLRSQAPTMDDPILMEWFHDLIYRLVPDSDLQISDLHLVTVDSPQLNAFAVPGGIVGINYGLLLYSDNEDQVASVLAHELAHLSQRHFARQVEAARKRDPVTLATLLASLILIATSNGEAGIAGIMTTQAAAVQSQLAYTREFEREADRLGMTTLVNSGFSPDAMPAMFRNMLDAARFRGDIPEFLQTHPLTATRVADAAGRAGAYAGKQTEKSFRFRVLRLKAEARYLLGDEAEVEFTKRLDEATSSQRDALLYMLAYLDLQQERYQAGLKTLEKVGTPNLLTNILQQQLLASSGERSRALDTLRELRVLHPNSLPLESTYATVLADAGNYAEATRVLRHLTEDYPDNPGLWESLSQNASKQKDLILASRALAEYYYTTGRSQEAAQQLRNAIRQAELENDLQRELALKARLKVIDVGQRPPRG